jgi:hypothetical protein
METPPLTERIISHKYNTHVKSEFEFEWISSTT